MRGWGCGWREGIVPREQGTGWRPMAGEGLGQGVLKSEVLLSGGAKGRRDQPMWGCEGGWTVD